MQEQSHRTSIKIKGREHADAQRDEREEQTHLPVKDQYKDHFGEWIYGRHSHVQIVDGSKQPSKKIAYELSRLSPVLVIVEVRVIAPTAMYESNQQIPILLAHGSRSRDGSHQVSNGRDNVPIDSKKVYDDVVTFCNLKRIQPPVMFISCDDSTPDEMRWDENEPVLGFQGSLNSIGSERKWGDLVGDHVWKVHLDWMLQRDANTRSPFLPKLKLGRTSHTQDRNQLIEEWFTKKVRVVHFLVDELEKQYRRNGSIDLGVVVRKLRRQMKR